MPTRAQQIEDEVKTLIAKKDWKGHLTFGIIALFLWGLIVSPLFLALKFLVEAVLLFGGIALIVYAMYEYSQLELDAKKK